ncbi:MAG: DUF58 domain-containing protein, partial [Acidobacteriota bacterium]
EIRLARRLTVYPAVKRVDISSVFQERSGPVPQRERPGESDEFLRLRDYAVGDNLHHIHWKATAKLSRLTVREFASEQQRRFCIVLDNTRATKEADVRGNPGRDEFEALVSAGASLAVHLASHGLAFRFISADEQFLPDSSKEHLRGVLVHLATVGLRPRPVDDLLARAKEAVEREEMVLVLTASQAAPLPWLSWPRLHTISPSSLSAEAETVQVGVENA